MRLCGFHVSVMVGLRAGAGLTRNERLRIATQLAAACPSCVPPKRHVLTSTWSDPADREW